MFSVTDGHAKVRVFAYGSNLCLERIAARIEHVRPIATGTVRGYQLRFNKKSRDGSAKANAHATGVDTDVVWGAVYEMEPADKRRLDVFEGLGTHYFESQVEVATTDGSSLSAWMYHASPAFIDEGIAPYDWYHRFCVEGARYHGFPDDYVARIAASASDPDPDRARYRREVAVLSGEAMKGPIVSLLPSATEIVTGLGLGDRLVGRSHECDYPPDVKALPACTAARLPSDGSSADIDSEVKRLLQQSLSIYRVDEEMLRRLRPRLIVTQSQCEVCAVSLDEVEDAARRALGGDVKVISLGAENLDGIWADIELVGEATGLVSEASRLVSGLRRRIAAVESEVRDRAPVRPGVLCVEWLDPLMAAGNWMPEIVEKAGGRSLLAHAGANSPWIEWERVAAEDPDVIVVLPCGFSIERTRSEMEELRKRPGWSKLKAVRSGRVALADGNQYFNRPGPRIVESVEIMAEIVHPELFDFGHLGAGWQHL